MPLAKGGGTEINMEIKIADYKDINKITNLRMIYLKEAYGSLSKNDEKKIKENNIIYLRNQLNNSCFVAFVT